MKTTLAILLLASSVSAAEYVGMESCRPCHQRPDQPFVHVTETSWHGKAASMENGKLVLGSHNVKTYVNEDGQVSTNAYDVNNAEWFDFAEASVRSWIPWDGPVPQDHRAWNSRSCLSCHTTGPDLGVTCESCHGPASEHIRLVQEDNYHFQYEMVSWKVLTKEQRDDLCFSCHDIDNSIDVLPNGAYRGEGQHYAWTQNPCVQARADALPERQIECLSCHTSAGRFTFADNPDQACAQCHDDGRSVYEAMTKYEHARIPHHDHSFKSYE